MSRMSPAAVQSRAKAIMEAMQACEVWTYAIPRESALDDVRKVLKSEGFSAGAPLGAGAALERWHRGEAWVSLTDDEALDVVLLRAAGVAAVPCMAQVLELTGFFAQTELLSTAADLDDSECEQALLTLAHMVCAWDEAWHRLFAWHLEDAELRGSALTALRIVTAQVDDQAVSALVERWAREP